MSGTSRTRRGDGPSIRRFRSVFRLIQALESLPSDALYDDPDAWVFRGVGSDAYTLLPCALRPATRLSVHGRIRRVQRLGERDAVQAEAWILALYLQALQRMGLAVPGGGERCRELLRRVTRTALPTPNLRLGQDDAVHDLLTWPSEELLPLLGLAQHHGVPTRLLDFTWDARIACYFAATQALREKSTSFSVWAVNAAQLQMDVEIRKRILETGAVTTDPGARFVFVDASFNPRLRAQRGLFILAREYETQIPGNEGPPTWQPIEYMSIPALRAKGIRRFDLSRRLAPELLAHLARSGVDASAVYPDHAGAWLSVQERVKLAQRKLRQYQGDKRHIVMDWDSAE